jgi:hypothetical protein
MILATANQLVASLLLFLGTVVIVGNWSAPVVSFVRKRNVSMIPLLGGMFGAAGCFLSPWGFLNSLWWLPLIIDIGCIPMLVLFAFSWVAGRLE